jgi:hypothetical protein
MIRKVIVVAAAVAASFIIAPAASASADPAVNGHDCAGLVVSSLAGPGFGAVVSAAAHDQLVDNLGLADCGQTNRNNP